MPQPLSADERLRRATTLLAEALAVDLHCTGQLHSQRLHRRLLLIRALDALGLSRSLFPRSYFTDENIRQARELERRVEDAW